MGRKNIMKGLIKKGDTALKLERCEGGSQMDGVFPAEVQQKVG